MADEQFDVSEKMKQLFAQKHKMRQEAKAYFAKAMENPHRAIHEPPPFDPVFFRYATLQTYGCDYFRPNPRNLFITFFFIVAPVVGLTIYAHNFRKERERILRGGEVAYKDRVFRNIL